jgi:hypothetical protein
VVCGGVNGKMREMLLGSCGSCEDLGGWVG